ncbi:MAG TPA: Xaa-Pro peptidase family protein [Blastocatellia bacterium]|nr:Xaa-Pro peptidase family protein [Blastocatellia bacterium]
MTRTIHPRRTGARGALIALAVFVIFSTVQPAARPARAADDSLLAGIAKSEYRARRQQLMSRIKDGIVVMIGAREDEFGEVGRFRQKNDFMYLTGVETPSAYLVLVPEGLIADRPAKETLLIPARNQFQEKWTGPQIGPGAEGQAAYGFQEVADSARLNDLLNELLKSPAFKPATGKPAAKLYTIIPRGSTADIERETGFVATLRQNYFGLQVVEVAPILAEMRKVKSAAEMALLQKAIDITGEAQREAAAQIRPGAFEYEVQAALEAAFTRNGAERPGFPSIVGSGFYSTVLHYDQDRKKIDAGDTVVVDIGAEFSYYTADITRTYPASGKFTPRQREVYQLVLDAQRAAERAFKPGQSTIAQMNQVARETMKASPLRDRQGNTLERYFIHGLGHWLGMEVHDVGGYGNLPVGAVFTIEPGIYIPEEKLGVRIEDDYMVTEKGLVKLSRAIPSEPDEIERIVQSHSKAMTAAPQK